MKFPGAAERMRMAVRGSGGNWKLKAVTPQRRADIQNTEVKPRKQRSWRQVIRQRRNSEKIGKGASKQQKRRDERR